MPKLIAKSIDDLDVSHLTFHTQNQHMVQAVRRFCPKDRLFPIDGNVPEDVKEMGISFAKYPERYDSNLMVEKKFYVEGSPLYGDKKERISSHEDIKLFFEQNVNFQEGDSVLVIGLIDRNNIDN
jgi:hypothetical protein